MAAVREAEHWMLDRTRYCDGLGAIYPSMMYLIMALDSLGYPKTIRTASKPCASRKLIIETPDRSSSNPATRRSGTRRTRLSR